MMMKFHDRHGAVGIATARPLTEDTESKSKSKPKEVARQPAPSYADVHDEAAPGQRQPTSRPLQQRERSTLAPAPAVARLPVTLAQDLPQLRSTMMMVELMQYIDDHLAAEPPPHRPELLGALAEVVRKVTLKVEDAQWGEAFSALVQIAGHDTLTQAQLVPVFQAMVRGPEELGHMRLGAAVRSMCGHFKDKVLPEHWYRAMMQAAQAQWDETRSTVERKGILWLLEASVIALPEDDPHRIAQDKALLRAAVQTCADAPHTPVGLVACIQRAMMREPGPRITARVFEAVAATPDLSAAQLDNVMSVLGAGVVTRLDPTPAQMAQRLRPLVAWAMEQPPAHRDGALAGLACGICRDPDSHAMSAAHLQAVLHVLGQLRDPITAAGARHGVARFVATILAPMVPMAGAGSTHDSKAAAPPARKSAAEADKPAAPAEGGSDTGSIVPSTEGALAGLRLLLGHGPGDACTMGTELVTVGEALAQANGGRNMAPQALQALVGGLLDSDIPDAQAGLILQGLARGVGAAAMSEARFAAFVQHLWLASELRGAVLSCHLFAAINACGTAGRALETPVSLRVAQTLMNLPQPVRENMGLPPDESPLSAGLLLGVNLADGPLSAVCGNGLPREVQRQVLAAACRVPGLLDDALTTDLVQDCALLAVDDPDFALKAAQGLLEQDHHRVSETTLRQLRAGLAAQVLGPHAAGRDGLPLAAGLERLGALYESFALKHGRPRMAATRAFLAGEAALVRSGPHRDVLEPLAAKLEALASGNGGAGNGGFS